MSDLKKEREFTGQKEDDKKNTGWSHCAECNQNLRTLQKQFDAGSNCRLI